MCVCLGASVGKGKGESGVSAEERDIEGLEREHHLQTPPWVDDEVAHST